MTEFDNWNQFYHRLLLLHNALDDICVALNLCAQRAPASFEGAGKLGASVVELRAIQGRFAATAELVRPELEKARHTP